MIYVDPLQSYNPANLTARVARVGVQWCHLWADDTEELHAFAARIGMKRAWFQNHPRLPHYDLVPSRRAAAIAAGAVEMSVRQWFRQHAPQIQVIPDATLPEDHYRLNGQLFQIEEVKS